MGMKRVLGSVFVCFSIILLLISSVCYARLGQPSKAVTIVRNLSAMDDDYFAVPQVSGIKDGNWQDKINETLKNQILSFRNPTADSSLQGDFSVSFFNGQLLGIQWVGLSNTRGSAHPNKIDTGIHLDVNTGKIYKLADLFQPNVDYMARIRELCFRNEKNYRLTINGQWDEWTYTTFAESWTGENFLLSDKAVRVYDSLNYATGYYSGYSVPYDDLMDIINTEGDLWKALKGQAQK